MEETATKLSMGSIDSLLNALRDINTSQRDLGNAIRANTEAYKASQNPHQGSPGATSPFQLPEAIGSYYQAEQDERPSNRKWKIGERVFVGLTFGVAVAGAIFTYCTLKQVTRQADAAQRQLEAMQYSQRPWLGPDGQISLTDGPKFRVISPISISTAVEGIVTIKNFGSSPAFFADASVTPYAVVNSLSTITPPPRDVVLCPLGSAQNHSGEVVFPGNSIRAAFSAEAPRIMSVPITEVPRVWLIGCISYRIGSDKFVHHTRFWLRSIHPLNPPWIQLSSGFRYLPVTGFELWGEESD